MKRARPPKLRRLAGLTVFAALALVGLAHAAPTSAPSAGPRALTAVPDAMIGTWGWSGEHCGPNNDGRLTVSAKAVAFAAATYDLQSMVQRQDGTVRAAAIVHEEGETGTTEAAIELKLRTANSLWIHTDALDHSYANCTKHP